MKIKKAIILGAGFGKRMYPITKKIPKPLVKIRNKTILENTINFLISLGVKHIVINTHYLHNKISNFVKNISGVIIAFISVPLGIGGGSLMVPFMRTFGYDIRKSIGTAAAVGFLIALSGTITMIIGGNIIDNVNTPFSLGYINILGFIVFVPVTMIMARIGAKAVYKINKTLLSKIFGTFLIIVSIRSFVEYLTIN